MNMQETSAWQHGLHFDFCIPEFQRQFSFFAAAAWLCSRFRAFAA
jgi:hypothetical protein